MGQEILVGNGKGINRDRKNPLCACLGVFFLICLSTLFIANLLLLSIVCYYCTLLRVDHATISVNRPFIAIDLVDYDVLQLLLPCIWICDGDSNFGQDIILSEFPPIMLPISIWATQQKIVIKLILNSKSLNSLLAKLKV